MSHRKRKKEFLKITSIWKQRRLPGKNIQMGMMCMSNGRELTSHFKYHRSRTRKKIVCRNHLCLSAKKILYPCHRHQNSTASKPPHKCEISLLRMTMTLTVFNRRLSNILLSRKRWRTQKKQTSGQVF